MISSSPAPARASAPAAEYSLRRADHVGALFGFFAHVRWAFLAVVLPLLAAVAARAEIEFTGVFVMAGRAQVALAEDSGRAATWRNVGQTFAGYRIESYDAKTETVTLVKADARLLVKLKDGAKTKNLRLELKGAITTGRGEKLDVSRAALPFGQETVISLKDGVTWRVTPTLLPDGNYLFEVGIELVGANGSTERVAAPRVITRAGQPFKIMVGDFQFSFEPGKS